MESANTATERVKTDGIQVVVSEDRLTVRLACSAEFVGIPGIGEEIRSRLNELKVTAKVREERLEQELERAKGEGVGIEGLVIAEGTPHVPSVDSSIEWSKNYFEDGYYVDPKTHIIDYHRKAAVPQVAKDDLIAIFHAARQGKDGVDVFGKPIPTNKPHQAEIRPGLHVYFDEQASGFKSDCGGRVKYNGKVLEVHDFYEVPGSVGATTGNVDHNGAVTIKGGVDAEFKVSAKGDIDVAELIGAADIDCGGNLTASNGIRSTHNKRVVVKGNVHAKYLEYATIFAEGDIIVETEISTRSSGQPDK